MSDIVVEVRGGLAVEIYSTLPDARLILVDWDNIHEGDDPICRGEAAPLSLMPEDTCAMYNNAVFREDIEHAPPGSP